MNSGENSDILDKKTNDKKNVPVLVITYFVVIIFICMFAYIIVFMVRDSRTFIANSYNGRQSLYAEKIKKGSIISSDGNVLAETLTDDDGNEYRNYPYSNVFAHVVGYDSNGQAGLEMSSASRSGYGALSGIYLQGGLQQKCPGCHKLSERQPRSCDQGSRKADEGAVRGYGI